MKLNRKRLNDAVAYLSSRDADLSRIVDSDGNPPLWDRKPGFPSLVHIILEQQVSLASAKAVYLRVRERITPFTAENLLAAGKSSLREAGVTRQKTRYCQETAKAVLNGSLDLAGLSYLDDIKAGNELMQVTGIGYWTARIYLLMVLLRPDVWPSGDIALMNTVKHIKRLPSTLLSHNVDEIAEQWIPYRSVAARMLWQHYLNRRKELQ